MLKTTLNTTFTPGVNLKGQAVGANWPFLLPHLPVHAVLIVGLPTPATLKMVAHLADQIIVLCRTTGQQQKAADAQRKFALPKLTVLLFSPTAPLALRNQTIDLVLMTDQASVRWLAQTPALWQEVRRLLTPTGLLYYEYRGRRDPLQTFIQSLSPSAATGQAQSFWLTPLHGDLQTAVPLTDQATVAYALAHGHYRSSVDLNTWKRWSKLLRGKRAPAQPGQAKPQAAVKAPPTSKTTNQAGRSRPTLRRRLKRTFKNLVIKGTKRLEQVEQALYQRPWLRALFQRQGVLLHKTPPPTDQPPTYLQSLAQTAGINLAHHRWLLSAKGEYSSRKVLFFLFAPDAQTPTYIVKMTRDPVLNGRVENEYQALAQLYVRGIGSPATLPKPLFLGRHAGLAVVGETIIDGSAFSKHTQRSADCPHLRAAVDFFVQLGTATKDSASASPAKAAQVLATLFERFTAIYQLSPAHHAFLAAQIEQVRLCEQSFPLVFQHGDPGPWNMLVTPDGEIAVLDWEAAESQGMPLWDLLYFLRSYCVDVGRAQGVNDVLRAFQSQLLADTPLGNFVAETINRYSAAIDLPPALIKPLFYTCWMHRALKEATRLPVNKVETGRFVSLLRLCIDSPTAPLFQQLPPVLRPVPACETPLTMAKSLW